jgi:hypothetical protein
LHKGNFQANVGNNLPFKETFEHAWPTCDDYEEIRNSAWIHGDIFQQMYMNQGKSLQTSRTHTSWWHKDGSKKYPTLVPNVIDGLNNKLIKILHEDGLICYMN